MDTFLPWNVCKEKHEFKNAALDFLTENTSLNIQCGTSKPSNNLCELLTFKLIDSGYFHNYIMASRERMQYLRQGLFWP